MAPFNMYQLSLSFFHLILIEQFPKNLVPVTFAFKVNEEIVEMTTFLRIFSYIIFLNENHAGRRSVSLA